MPLDPRRPSSSTVALAVAGLLATAFVLHALNGPPISSPRSSTHLAPAWHDFVLVNGMTRPLEQAVLPVALRHLDALHVNNTFSPIWISSAFLDTRPIVVGAAPEIAILGVGPSILADEIFWNDTPLFCSIALRRKGHREYLTSPAAINALPDGHVESKLWIGIIVTCPLLYAVGKGVEWDGAEM